MQDARDFKCYAVGSALTVEAGGYEKVGCFYAFWSSAGSRAEFYIWDVSTDAAAHAH